MARKLGPRGRMEITGLREMQRALQKLPDELQRPLVKRALIDAAQPMRDMAEELAPDAPPFGEGLPANIITSDQLASSQADAERPERRDEARVYVGVDGERPDSAPHGILAEFGTGPRHHESGKYVGEMPAQPFMRPAFDATARVVINRFAGLLRPLIQNAAKRVRRT